MKNKKGWIKIVEAFVAILLVAGVALIVVESGGLQREDISAGIQDIQLSIIREIQLNDTLRNEIVGTSGEVEWDGFDSNAPLTKSKIESKTPSYLICEAKICGSGDSCFYTGEQEKDVFAQPVLISSSLDTFNPRVLKLFCWVNE
jgi:hypothetical protein